VKVAPKQKVPVIALTKLFQNTASSRALPRRELRRLRHVRGAKISRFCGGFLRIAEALTGEDRVRLMKIADAWTELALEGETIMSSGKKNPGDDTARP
jgi:hypothetical protein